MGLITKTKIEWCDYSINPIKGICKHNCPYCYAIRQYKRFKWNPEVRLDLSVFDECKRMKAGSKVFVCSTHDICGSWIPDEWIELIVNKIKEYPDLIFILLTKVPGRFFGYSLPANVWLGTTVESQKQVGRIETLLLVDAEKRFVSFEPLQSKIDFKFDFQRLDWIILGAETGNRKDRVKPETDWVTHLLWTHSNVPAFMKDNLRPYFHGEMYQQFPAGQ